LIPHPVALRASVSYKTTTTEIDQLVSILSNLINIEE
jgi:selenocysteine lyase/cysteine desulfurase